MAPVAPFGPILGAPFISFHVVDSSSHFFILCEVQGFLPEVRLSDHGNNGHTCCVGRLSQKDSVSGHDSCEGNWCCNTLCDSHSTALRKFMLDLL